MGSFWFLKISRLQTEMFEYSFHLYMHLRYYNFATNKFSPVVTVGVSLVEYGVVVSIIFVVFIMEFRLGLFDIFVVPAIF